MRAWHLSSPTALASLHSLAHATQILVCAPSNGAIDELTQRIALEGGGVWDASGKPVAPRVVRLGNPSEESAARVKAVSLHVMVEKRFGDGQRCEYGLRKEK